MAILLTTPIFVGALDSSDYTHLKIVSFSLDSLAQRIQVQWSFGRMVNGQFVFPLVSAEGLSGAEMITGAAYTAMIATAGQSGSALYDQVAAVLYQHLIDNAVVTGTIE